MRQCALDHNPFAFTICLSHFLLKKKSAFFSFFSSCRQVQKLQNIISNRACQYNHEMKRREREFTKLKERLNQLLADKKERKQGKIVQVFASIILKVYKEFKVCSQCTKTWKFLYCAANKSNNCIYEKTGDIWEEIEEGNLKYILQLKSVKPRKTVANNRWVGNSCRTN